jgi:hypothetical protein
VLDGIEVLGPKSGDGDGDSVRRNKNPMEGSLLGIERVQGTRIAFRVPLEERISFNLEGFSGCRVFGRLRMERK